jgi:hypothetical protein
LITVELRRFELLTSSMRTRVNAGSRHLTKSPSDVQGHRTGFTSDHEPSRSVHARSLSKCYAKCYAAVVSAPAAQSDARRRNGRIETNMTATESTTDGILGMPQEFMTRSEAASYLRRSPGTLANWAAQRKGPAYYRQLDGAVVYAKEDMAEWLSSQRVTPRAA